MKTKLLYLLVLGMMLSCAAPKRYTYNFDYYQYTSANRSEPEKVAKQVTTVTVEADRAQAIIDSKAMTASIEAGAVVMKENPVEMKVKALAEKYRTYRHSDDKAERIVLKKELKDDIKVLKKDVRHYMKRNKADDSVTATKAMDMDLKLAIIFTLLAIAAGIIFDPLGFLLFVVAIVFFAMWLMRQ